MLSYMQSITENLNAGYSLAYLPAPQNMCLMSYAFKWGIGS